MLTLCPPVHIYTDLPFPTKHRNVSTTPRHQRQFLVRIIISHFRWNNMPKRFDSLNRFGIVSHEYESIDPSSTSLPQQHPDWHAAPHERRRGGDREGRHNQSQTSSFGARINIPKAHALPSDSSVSRRALGWILITCTIIVIIITFYCKFVLRSTKRWS